MKSIILLIFIMQLFQKIMLACALSVIAVNVSYIIMMNNKLNKLDTWSSDATLLF